MGVTRGSLLAQLDELLMPENFSDYCPNGLQVEGGEQVFRLVTGVSACMDLLEAAIELEAQAVLVHHGYFWKGEDPCLRGPRRKRLALLLEHDINLFAYHLPLDEHPLFGNNVRLAAQLGITVCGNMADDCPGVIGLTGKLPEVTDGTDFATHIGQVLGREPLHISADRAIQRIAWCSGAGQAFVEQAAGLGVDAYLSGEVSEQTVHAARELGIHYFAAGHHATERYGVQAVGEHLAKTLALEHRFVDIDNPA